MTVTNPPANERRCVGALPGAKPGTPETIAETDIVIPAPGRCEVAARIYLQAAFMEAAFSTDTKSASTGTKHASTGTKHATQTATRRATRTLPAVLHFHGGAFTCGTLDDGRIVCHLLADAGAMVVSIAYPLAPAAPFPVAVDVGYAALRWLHRQRVRIGGRDTRIYVAGEEAGGNLAAALSLVARDRAGPPLAGQILLSPMLDPCSGTSSIREAGAGSSECPWARGWQAYLNSPNDTTHPYAVPAASLRLAQLPPTLIIVGHIDGLRDEGLKFAARLRAAGVPVDSLELMNCTRPTAGAAPETTERQCALTVLERIKGFFASGTPPPGRP